MAALRRATPHDAPGIAALVERAYSRYIERIAGPPAPMLEDYATVVEQAEVWVASDETGLLGCLVLVPHADHLLLDNVAVRPDVQGRGIGRELLVHADHRARELGLPEVRLYTNVTMTENRSYYATHGYVETHTATEHGFERVYFVRELDD
jgi:N-acetylglutamate synthase-like GNAT family acetyltransferase